MIQQIPQPSLPLVLGSSSKWRARILERTGLKFTTMNPNIDESKFGGSRIIDADPSKTCLEIANAKADELQSRSTEPCIVICSDQVVAYDGKIREKPATRAEAKTYLESYRNDKPAETHTAIVVFNSSNGKRVQGVDVAKQYFAPIPENVVTALINKGDVFHCAGGFMIDDDLVVPLLRERVGDEDSIIGLPLALLSKLLQQVI